MTVGEASTAVGGDMGGPLTVHGAEAWEWRATAHRAPTTLRIQG